MKKIISLFLITLLLFSCSKTDTTVQDGKKDFSIQIKSLKSLGGDSFLQKSGKIQGKDDIKLSSQAVGRIGSIGVKEGDKVKAGQSLVFLTDTIANYGINLDKASNSIEKMQITYDSTKVSLDKQIFDLEIALEKLNNSLDTLKKTSSIDISQAKDNLSNTNYSGMDTKSSLELQKMDNSISKAELDYNNTLSNNQETITNFKNSLNKEYITQKTFFDDIITFGDKLLGATKLYEYQDDYVKMKNYLGVKDAGQKDNTKNLLLNLISKRDTVLNNMSFDNLSEDDILNYITIFEGNYTLIEAYLNSLEITINNSIISIGQLNQSQIDAFSTTTNAYQSQFAINNAGFIGFKNGTSSFLKTYKNNESSLAKQLELLKKDKEIFLKNYDLGGTQSENTLDKIVAGSEDSIKSLELQIRQTVDTIKTSKESRDLTLKGLENSMRDAYIGQEVAIKDYNKLNIKASIDGVVGDILVDEGQDVTIGMPILSIISDKASQVELSFKESELASIAVGDNVLTKIGEKTLTGMIYSISSISSDSLNYKVLAVFNEKIQNLGGVIDVSIPIKAKAILIPLEYINLIGTNKGIVNIYDNGKIVQKEVLLGKMYKNNIEFLSFLDGTKLDDKIMIITTDISNYDENKFNLKVEQ
ncbi:MAG: HlyD family efflux transporter periplasmic adaptor subunit [Candidatus Gracilibacteria bacterium]